VHRIAAGGAAAEVAMGETRCHLRHDDRQFGIRVDLVLAERLPRLSWVATMCQDVVLSDWQSTLGAV
jgi:hypothetical protein